MAFDISKLTSGSWKTALFGIITAMAGFVEFSPHLFEKWPWITAISKYIMVGGLAAMGFSSKDRAVTGGTVANPKNNPTIVKETAESTSPTPPK